MIHAKTAAAFQPIRTEIIECPSCFLKYKQYTNEKRKLAFTATVARAREITCARCRFDHRSDDGT
jgi:hypothetical protein